MGHVARIGERINSKDFVGISGRKRQTGRALLRWKDNIKTDIREIK